MKLSLLNKLAMKESKIAGIALLIVGGGMFCFGLLSDGITNVVSIEGSITLFSLFVIGLGAVTHRRVLFKNKAAVIK